MSSRPRIMIMTSRAIRDRGFPGEKRGFSAFPLAGILLDRSEKRPSISKPSALKAFASSLYSVAIAAGLDLINDC
jgi:hypothetical protein